MIIPPVFFLQDDPIISTVCHCSVRSAATSWTYVSIPPSLFVKSVTNKIFCHPEPCLPAGRRSEGSSIVVKFCIRCFLLYFFAISSHLFLSLCDHFLINFSIIVTKWTSRDPVSDKRLYSSNTKGVIPPF